MTAESASRYRYAGLDELGEEPHLMVDGAPRSRTTTTLSHWPFTPTPRALWRDLSAEIAFAYLREKQLWDHEVSVVTNDHLDVDGLVGILALTNPVFALEHEQLLVEVARVGDFGVVRSMQAAEVAWALEALMEDPQLAVVDLVDADVTREGAITATYRALLSSIVRIIDSPGLIAQLSRRARERFEQTNSEIASGLIGLKNRTDLDLCVVTVSPRVEASERDRVASDVFVGVDLCALHSATSASRMLIDHDGRFVYYDRYETWVRSTSRRRELRRDLTNLASELSAVDDVVWQAVPPSALVPVLHHGPGKSRLASNVMERAVVSYLAREPVGWDPFAARPDTGP